MSLLDALLLDPARINIWLAIRPNFPGSGSGTQQDPYNAGKVSASEYPVITISSIAFASASNIATITTAGAHGFQTGQRILVWGVTGANAKFFNGVFTVTVAAADQFDYQVTVAGTPAAPGTGSWSCQRNPYRFDDVMRSIPSTPKVAVHLGPGEYETLGYHENLSGGWQPASGMRIVGSGIDVTRIKLAARTAQSQQVYVIGHDLVANSEPNAKDFAEVSELTLDADFAANASQGLAVGGVRLMGNHCRVARVKLVGWGNANEDVIGYGLSVITALTDINPAQPIPFTNPGIDQCIVTQRAGTVSGIDPQAYVALHAGGKETPGSSSGVGRGAYIRNCFVDGKDPAGSTDFAVDRIGLSMDWCAGGVVEGNQVLNIKYGGPYMNEEPADEQNRGAYSVTVRNNSYRNVAMGPAWRLGTVASAQKPGVVKLLVEQNEIELTLTSAVTTFSAGTPVGELGVWGIAVADMGASPKPYGTVVIRENTIRYADGGTGDAKGGVLVQGALNLEVRENALDLPNVPANPLKNQRCSNASYFANRSSSGALIRGLNLDTSRLYDELETQADDALIFALLNS